jgi:hypothetical protein
MTNFFRFRDQFPPISGSGPEISPLAGAIGPTHQKDGGNPPVRDGPQSPPRCSHQPPSGHHQTMRLNRWGSSAGSWPYRPALCTGGASRNPGPPMPSRQKHMRPGAVGIGKARLESGGRHPRRRRRRANLPAPRPARLQRGQQRRHGKGIQPPRDHMTQQPPALAVARIQPASPPWRAAKIAAERPICGQVHAARPRRARRCPARCRG